MAAEAGSMSGNRATLLLRMVRHGRISRYNDRGSRHSRARQTNAEMAMIAAVNSPMITFRIHSGFRPDLRIRLLQNSTGGPAYISRIKSVRVAWPASDRPSSSMAAGTDSIVTEPWGYPKRQKPAVAWKNTACVCSAVIDFGLPPLVGGNQPMYRNAHSFAI